MKNMNRAELQTAAWAGLVSLLHSQRETWRADVVRLTGMPFSRYLGLRRLADGPCSGRELAERLGVDAPAASAITGDLLERGLAHQETDPADRRRRLVSLTDPGRDLLARIDSGAVPAPALDGLSDDELADLHRLLTKANAR